MRVKSALKQQAKAKSRVRGGEIRKESSALLSPTESFRPWDVMSLPMQLAWLLRADVRAGREIESEDGQKEFICWWIVFGRTEYSAIWTYRIELASIAMEMTECGDGQVPRLIRFIWNNRGDLQSLFAIGSADGRADLLCWYRLFGPSQYPGGFPLAAADCLLTDGPSPIPLFNIGVAVPRMAVLMRAFSPEMIRLFDPRLVPAQEGLVQWYHNVGVRRIPEFAVSVHTSEAPVHLQLSNEFGVNLIGFAHAEFGLGEDVRMVSAALDRALVPYVVLDARTPDGVRGRDNSCSAEIVERLRYRISIFCMSAFDTAGLLLQRGDELFGANYNIGYWPWELPRFPKAWSPVMSLVSEIWAATKYQLDAYKASTSKPVVFLPPAVEVAIPTISRPRTRRPYTFIYPFDPRSYLSRKNPTAAVKAFRKAFPRNDMSVTLILRVNGQPRLAAGWDKVWRAANGDKRIQILPGTMDKKDSLALLMSCDCLVSPHRAEGFGRNIAEAIELNVPVIATAFSGSGDYLSRTERLRFTLRTLGPSDYPFGAGQRWSEPSVKDLAAQMRWARVQTPSLVARRKRAKRFQKVYAPRSAGLRFRDRLLEIYRHEIILHIPSQGGSPVC